MDRFRNNRPDFPEDAFIGTAVYYARYRVPYPRVLIDDLLRRAGVSGTGKLPRFPGELQYHDREKVLAVKKAGTPECPDMCDAACVDHLPGGAKPPTDMYADRL